VTPQSISSFERPQPRERFLLYLVPGLAVLLVITLFALAFLMLGKSREAAMRDGQRASAYLAQIVEERTERLLQSIDQTLRSTAETWQRTAMLRDASGAALHALLAEKAAQLPNARTLFVLDARGMLLQDSNIRPAAPIDLSDRDYFSWHRSHAGNRLYVSKPAPDQRNSGWFVVATRRLEDAQGHFAGIVGVALEPAAFKPLVDKINVGRAGASALMHERGELIARAPEAPKWLGVPTGSSTTLGARTYLYVSEIDGVSRIYSARPVAGTALIAQVGLSQDELLAGWRHELNVAVAILAAFTLATVLLAWILMQGLIRRNELARSVGRNERMLRQVFETLPVGVRVADRQGHVVLSNAASGRIWGDAEKELHYFTDRKKELPQTADRGMALTLTRGESSRNEVLDVECSDGTRKTVLHSTAPIVSAEGEIVGGVAVNEDIT